MRHCNGKLGERDPFVIDGALIRSSLVKTFESPSKTLRVVHPRMVPYEQPQSCQLSRIAFEDLIDPLPAFFSLAAGQEILRRHCQYSGRRSRIVAIQVNSDQIE